jgi:hypothetical protein
VTQEYYRNLHRVRRWLDTEGCEVDILEDLGDRIARVDILYLEWHSAQIGAGSMRW